MFFTELSNNHEKRLKMLKILLITSFLAAPVAIQAQTMQGMQMTGTDQTQMTPDSAMSGNGMNMDMGNGTSGDSGMGAMSGDMTGGAGMQGAGNMQGMQGMMQMMSGMMQMMQSMQGMMNGEQGGMSGGGMGMNMNMGGQTAAMSGNATGMARSPLTEPGQSAFATIAEVVRVMDANPDTDWSTVDIDALRAHLQDMDRVTLDSVAVAEDIEGGVRFTVTGDDRVAPSIARMVVGHARVMDGTDGWRYTAEVLPNGAQIDVLVPAGDLAKLKGLGFYGLLASGPHHQPHHWAMANGTGMGN